MIQLKDRYLNNSQTSQTGNCSEKGRNETLSSVSSLQIGHIKTLQVYTLRSLHCRVSCALRSQTSYLVSLTICFPS